jgi:hypothetical protein
VNKLHTSTFDTDQSRNHSHLLLALLGLGDFGEFLIPSTSLDEEICLVRYVSIRVENFNNHQGY